jgi:hypothetical protein
MSRRESIRHEFVEFIPEKLEEGVVYVCIPYATAAHRCCCGCGHEVVTPLTPTDWSLIWNGDTISLDPSIGNWGFPCQSHYWIRRNIVRWVPRWGRGKIDAARGIDRREKAKYYKGAKGLPPSTRKGERPSTK